MTPTIEEFLELARYDWAYTPHGEKLHAVVEAEEREGYCPSVSGYGVTACGLSSFLHIPGLLERMSVPRCKPCCRATGLPEGDGSPKNDKTCREIMGLS